MEYLVEDVTRRLQSEFVSSSNVLNEILKNLAGYGWKFKQLYTTPDKKIFLIMEK